MTQRRPIDQFGCGQTTRDNSWCWSAESVENWWSRLAKTPQMFLPSPTVSHYAGVLQCSAPCRDCRTAVLVLIAAKCCTLLLFLSLLLLVFSDTSVTTLLVLCFLTDCGSCSGDCNDRLCILRTVAWSRYFIGFQLWSRQAAGLQRAPSDRCNQPVTRQVRTWKIVDR